MDINTAKALVVRAGMELVDSGLIARTWGNVSARVDSNHFVITPSGKPYESLTPDDIVLVTIDDLSYDSEIKPSSEKGVHAEAYKLRPDCNFVIHTHQLNASAVSLFGFDINVEDDAAKAIIGPAVPVAKYGLSGTGKLKTNVSIAIARSPESKAVIMAHHGAVCMGEDYDEAFRVARELERVCASYILGKFERFSGTTSDDFIEIAAYIAQVKAKARKAEKLFTAYESERNGDTFVMNTADGTNEAIIDMTTGMASNAVEEFPASAELHRAVYACRKDVNSIIHTKSPGVVEYSKIGGTIRPLLDDFAQIVGVTMRTGEYDPDNAKRTAKRIVRKLKGRNAVMLKNNGALCVAGSRYDAQAVQMVLEKDLRAETAANLIGKAKRVGRLDALLERTVYTLKYSKQAEK